MNNCGDCQINLSPRLHILSPFIVRGSCGFPFFMKPVYLNNKTLVNAIKTDYEAMYDLIKEEFNYSVCMKYLRAKHMQYGVCLYAEKAYNRIISNLPWIKRHTNVLNTYWCETPARVSTSLAIKQVIVHRIKVLEKILNEL